jgi:hypothetical protein
MIAPPAYEPGWAPARRRRARVNRRPAARPAADRGVWEQALSASQPVVPGAWVPGPEAAVVAKPVISGQYKPGWSSHGK